MSGENIIVLVILGFVAFVMTSIGAVQFRSSRPVGFYNGEIPPKPEELTDVRAWNHAHGTMWMLFGASILGCGLLGILLDHAVWSPVLMTGGVLVPLPLMVLGHHMLQKKYRR